MIISVAAMPRCPSNVPNIGPFAFVPFVILGNPLVLPTNRLPVRFIAFLSLRNDVHDTDLKKDRRLVIRCVLPTLPMYDQAVETERHAVLLHHFNASPKILINPGLFA